MKAYKDNEESREQFYKQNPDARTASQRKGVRNEKEIMSIVGTKEDQEGSGSNAAGGGPSGEHAALFDGPADLALQRKLEREGKKE
jgi:hypothetical protein